MVTVIGVRFRESGRAYYFMPGDNAVRYGDGVIVETSMGVDYGRVIIAPVEIEEEKIKQELLPIIRVATPEDEEQYRRNGEDEKTAYSECKRLIREFGLEMKLIKAEYTFDRTKLLFYFTADGRIDFRELVKALASSFHTRIELRQIGVRDETRILGGIGSCGRPLCCHTFLSEFAPVSIKMAKEQNLSLNPTKISGCCGRLMCCLKNETETYAELNKGMPGKGDLVTTPDGRHGDVYSVNVLRQTVKVIVEMDNDEKEMQEYKVDEITFVPKSRKHKVLAEEAAAREAAAAEEAEGSGGDKTPGGRQAGDGDQREGRSGQGRRRNRKKEARVADEVRNADQKREPHDGEKKNDDRRGRKNREKSAPERAAQTATSAPDGGGENKSEKSGHRRNRRRRPHKGNGGKQGDANAEA